MGFQEYQQSLEWMAQRSITNNLMTGKVFIIRDNDKYDCIVLGDQSVVMSNLEPANPGETYSIGDEVFIGLPWGSLSILRILMRSNTSIPAEKVFTFRTKPAVSSGNIYLCCPSESVIRPYSILGVKGNDIPYKADTICTDGTYLYFTDHDIYTQVEVSPGHFHRQDYIFKYNIATEELTTIPISILVVTPSYIAVDDSGNIYFISLAEKIYKLSGVTATEIVANISAESSITSSSTLFYYENYLYISGISYIGFDSRVAKYSTSGTFIEVGTFPDMATTAYCRDADYFYANYNGTHVRIYNSSYNLDNTIAI